MVVCVLASIMLSQCVCNQSGRTSLHYAVSVRHPDTVKLLLDKGIARDVRTQRGEMALDMADDDEVRSLLQSYFPEQEL